MINIRRDDAASPSSLHSLYTNTLRFRKRPNYENIACLQFNPIQKENTYVVWDDTRKPSSSTCRQQQPARSDKAALTTSSPSTDSNLVLAVNTHGHFDHTLGVAHSRNATASPSSRSRPKGPVPAGQRLDQQQHLRRCGRRDAPGGHRPRHDARNPLQPHRPCA